MSRRQLDVINPGKSILNVVKLLVVDAQYCGFLFRHRYSPLWLIYEMLFPTSTDLPLEKGF